MKKLISFQFAARASLVIYAIFILFHLVIILGILFFNFVPIDYIWGGKLQSEEQLLYFEIFSLLVQSVCLFLTLIKAGYLEVPKLQAVAHAGMWVLFVLFLLNTLGNILAETYFEKSFAIITAILAIFALRLALEKRTT